ncbi:MAG: GIY-YIG nuclease family protein [Selenomonadaceae bacterium]|nr:GIY-YIG nuclease family protein [Selenomonadaceae bacterium]
MKVFGVVYLIWNLINGTRYVGQTTKTLKRRFDAHAACNTTLIGKAIQEYGKENFYCGVIVSCYSRAELDEKEKYFIAALKSKEPYGYNRTDGGEGFSGYKRKPEDIAKISAANTGKRHTEEHKAKIGLGQKGIPKSPEHRAKIKAALTGKPKSPEHCKKLSLSRKGKKLPPETCAKRSASMRGEKNPNFGKSVPNERRAKISAKERGYSPYKNLIAELDEHQFSYAALAKLMGIRFQNISRKIRGERNFTDADKIKLVEIFGKPAEYLLYREIDTEIKKKDRRNSPFKNLLNEMDKHRFTYKDLAQSLGLCYISIYKKMCGKNYFTNADKVKLVEIFGKSIDYLLQHENGVEIKKAPCRPSPYKNLISELDKRNLSYRALEKLMGATKSTIARKMRGEYNFNDADKAKLVEIFGKPIEYLLERSEG